MYLYVMLALHYDHYTLNQSVHLININQFRHISLALLIDSFDFNKVHTQLIKNRIPQIKVSRHKSACHSVFVRYRRSRVCF